MDALLPTLYLRPCRSSGYRGRFDPERALHLMAKYGVRNTFLFPTALKMMMKAVPAAARALRRASALDHERGRGGRRDGVRTGRGRRSASPSTRCSARPRSITSSAIRTSCGRRAPGSMGRPYPGHRVAVIDDAGNEVPAGEVGEVAVNRFDVHGDRDAVFFLELLEERRRRPPASTPATGAAPATSRRATPTAISGTRAAPTTSSRARATASARPRSRTAW